MTRTPAASPLRAPVSHLLLRDRALAITGLAMLVMAAVTVVLVAVDPRTFNGVSTWLKPLKFQLSLGVFLLTLAWFMGHVSAQGQRTRLAFTLRWVAIGTGIFEIVYITARGALNQASHFNSASAFGEAMFSLMGLAALALTATAGALALLIWRHGAAPFAAVRPFVVVGLLITAILGIVTGGAIGSNEGHWVGGAPTDAGGLPLVGWVRDGGDLRVAHFFALHAMQILPLVGAVALALPRLLRTGALALAAAGYVALVISTLFQAYRGEPFLAALVV